MSRLLNSWNEYSDFIDELYVEGYEFHHSALKRGYMNRKIEGEVNYYNGRFGEGYTIEKPRYDTTQYHTIQYFVWMD